MWEGGAALVCSFPNLNAEVSEYAQLVLTEPDEDEPTAALSKRSREQGQGGVVDHTNLSKIENQQLRPRVSDREPQLACTRDIQDTLELKKPLASWEPSGVQNERCLGSHQL